MQQNLDSILITDFDGTITRRDFFELVVPRYLDGFLPDYWTQYYTGKISHFEAMRSIFSHIRGSEEELRQLVKQMDPDPGLAQSVAQLRDSGWEVEVVSAGSAWYIEQILDHAGVSLRVHASPGVFDPDRGLIMGLDEDSPFCSPKTGIDKVAVVKHAQKNYRRVAFAGNGPPDLDPAVLVPADLRFARQWLAAELTKRSLGHRPFERWSEIGRALAQEPAR